MAVQRYSENEMEAIISNILKEDVQIVPIGNHELRRHLVYLVTTSKGEFVFKYYYQDIYGGREISTLRQLQNSDIKHAKLIDSGTFGQSREWLMMTKLEGEALDKIMYHIPEQDLLSIYKEMGAELGKLHKLKSYDAFGSLSEDQTFITKHHSFKDAYMASNEYCFKKIYTTDINHKALLIEAIKKIENNLDLLETIETAQLTHFDYSPRNIFVQEQNGIYTLKAVLDFELCRPWDKNADFCHLLLRDFPNHPELEIAFMSGYNAYNKLDDSFNRMIDFHMLSLCISVCSWAEKIAPHYYQTAFDKLNHLMHSKRLK